MSTGFPHEVFMFKLDSYTGGIASTNCWYLHTEGGGLLVDAPEGTADWLESQGLIVSALLLTHQHFDHVQDAAEVKKRHNCKIYAWSSYSQTLTLEKLFGVVSGGSLHVPAYKVDEVLCGEKSLRICGLDGSLLHIPGHSPDSVCFYSGEKGLVFGGDVLFEGSVCRTDLPGGSFQQLLQGIKEKLLTLPDATRVFPGHGSPTTVGEERVSNPFLNDH